MKHPFSESDNDSAPALRIAYRGRKKRGRDLINAVTLRPSEVYRLYGMPVSTVFDLCTHPDPLKRIESYKVPGRRGRKGSRYIDHAAFKLWLARWRTEEGTE